MTHNPSDLDALKKRVDDARRRQDEGDPAIRRGGGDMGLGMKLSVELVACVCVGVGAGLLLDRWLGTAPVFMLICVLLGTAAGFLSMYRSVQAASARELRDEASAKADAARLEEERRTKR